MDSPTGRVPRSEGGTWDDKPRMQSIRPENVHPKDRSVPGFTRDSKGNLKPGSSAAGPNAAQTGLADFLGAAMYGSEEWEERRKRAKREERTKSIMKAFFATGCFVIFALLVIASVLGLIVLVSWLVSLL